MTNLYLENVHTGEQESNEFTETQITVIEEIMEHTGYHFQASADYVRQQDYTVHGVETIEDLAMEEHQERLDMIEDESGRALLESIKAHIDFKGIADDMETERDLIESIELGVIEVHK